MVIQGRRFPTQYQSKARTQQSFFQVKPVSTANSRVGYVVTKSSMPMAIIPIYEW